MALNIITLTATTRKSNAEYQTYTLYFNIDIYSVSEKRFNDYNQATNDNNEWRCPDEEEKCLY